MLENIDNKATRGSISQIILKALSLGDKYGYEICKDIERLSNGKLILKQPSLYSCLRRMEEQKLISSYWKDSLLGGRRHYYSVTEKGKKQYEENKSIWKTDEELLKSLPDSETTAPLNDKSKTNENSTSTLNSNIPQKESTLYVLDQENLFNLARKKDEEIKKINNETNEDEKHTSFLQFDFFEQNIKVVKKNKEKADDIQVFTNKFSDLDNHSQEIEPENLIKNEESRGNSRISLSAILDKEIKRNDNNNSSNIASSLLNNSEPEKKSTGSSIFAYLKNNNQNETVNDKESNKDVNILEQNISENIYNKDLLSMKIDENSDNSGLEFINNKTDDEFNISWEKTEGGDAPLFDHDYKSAIGKLYNNSQLKDPYEQNKFQTFKEIFPSSTLKEKEQTAIRQTKIDAVIQSSSNSNIDCDDIRMLNNLYNLQGLNIKIHNNNENKRQNKIYRDKNKLNMICAGIVAFIGLVEFLICFLLLDKYNLFLSSQSVIYIVCSLCLLLVVLAFTIKNTFDRYKLIIIKKRYTKDFIVSLLVFLLLVVGAFAINVALGMNSLGQVKYLSYWLVPCILFSNLLLSQAIYAVLLKTKYFNS